MLLTPKEASSNGKLIAGGANELVSYDVKVDRASDNKSGQINLTVKDVLAGVGSFNSNNGKGDGTLLITLNNVQRKLKLDTTFDVDPNAYYNIKNDFYYDFEKDNGKKITFDTQNKMSDSNLVSNNVLDIQGEQYKLSIKQDLDPKLKYNKANTVIEFTLPNGRQIAAELKRDFKTVDNNVSGNGQFKLSDTLPNKKTRTWTSTGTITDGNIRDKLFNYNGKHEYVDFDGKNALVTIELKHLPNGHFHTASGSISAKGTMLPEVIDILLSADEYCEIHAVYRISAKYGGQFNINANGNYYVGNEQKPYTYEFQTAIAIPNAPIKQIKLLSNGKYAQPRTAEGVHELAFKVSGTFDDKTVNFDTSGRGNQAHGSATLSLNVPEIDPISVDAHYKNDISAVADENERKISTNGGVEIKYGKGKSVKANGDFKLSGRSDVTVHANLKTPFDDVKNVGVTYKFSVSRH